MPDNLDRTLKAEINLYYDFRPAPQTNAPLLISLHGYGANKRQMMRESRLIAPGNFAIPRSRDFINTFEIQKNRADLCDLDLDG